MGNPIHHMADRQVHCHVRPHRHRMARHRFRIRGLFAPPPARSQTGVRKNAG